MDCYKYIYIYIYIWNKHVMIIAYKPNNIKQ